MKYKIILFILLSIFLSACMNNGDEGEIDKSLEKTAEGEELNTANIENTLASTDIIDTSSLDKSDNSIDGELTITSNLDSSDKSTKPSTQDGESIDYAENPSSENSKNTNSSEKISIENDDFTENSTYENNNSSNVLSDEDDDFTAETESNLDGNIDKSFSFSEDKATTVNAYNIDKLKLEDLANVLVIDNNKIYLHDIAKENLISFMELDFKPVAINSIKPILIGFSNDTLYLYDFLNDNMKNIFYWEDTRLLSAKWSDDGRFLFFNIKYNKEGKSIVYLYDLERDIISAISMGNATDYLYDLDSQSALIVEKNFKKSNGKYEFKLKTSSIAKNIKTLYKIEGKSGSIYSIDANSNMGDNKAYIMLELMSEESDISNAFIYDFNADEMETIISFSDIYNRYMDRYKVDKSIKNVYSQLGKWVFPSIEYSKKDDSVYISDGNTYFFYPKRSMSSESEIGCYDSIEAINWLEEWINFKRD